MLSKYAVLGKDIKENSLSYAWGWVWSMWPMIGIRTLLGGLFFGVFKKPKSIFLVTNQIGFIPFLLLYFPHLRIGEFLWKAERLDFSFREMWDYVAADPIGSLSALLPSIMHAITGWLVLAPVHFFGTYIVVYYLLKKYERKN